VSDTGYRITDAPPSPAEIAAIHAGIGRADPLDAGPRRYAPLALTLRDGERRIAGGLLGATLWDWLLIEALWVDESARGRGYGRELLRAAETRAAAIGCGHASLGTFDFQARAFYEHHGYRVYAQLDGFPAGHTHYHLCKALESRYPAPGTRYPGLRHG
jgi:GNAT superfamily N-acetyltransferase